MTDFSRKHRRQCFISVLFHVVRDALCSLVTVKYDTLSDKKWWFGNALVSSNIVAQRRTRLILRWVMSVPVQLSVQESSKFISVCNHPYCSTQPGHPSVDKHNEYQPLQLGIKAYVCGSYLVGSAPPSIFLQWLKLQWMFLINGII